MRQIADCLNRALKQLVFCLVEQKCKQDRRRKAHDDGVKADQQSIADDTPGIRPLKKADEMFEAYPGAAPDTGAEIEIFKGDLNTRHRNIRKADVKHDDRNGHDIDPFVFGNILFDGLQDERRFFHRLSSFLKERPLDRGRF